MLWLETTLVELSIRMMRKEGSAPMQLDSVRELKASLNESVIKSLSAPPTVRSLGVRAMAMDDVDEISPTIALGVSRKGANDFTLAVRIQRRGLQQSKQVDDIIKKSKGEVDVRYVGRILASQAPTPMQKRTRPVKIGLSVGHFKITAGTLGAFVRDPKTGATMILSNNHVLANENAAKAGDAILQPGKFDGGRNPTDLIARLARFVKLKKTGSNLVDCAVAELVPGVAFNVKSLMGIRGFLQGAGASLIDIGTPVNKIGRTTGLTRGQVTAIELDNVVVGYDLGNLKFDNQIEIEGEGASPFSRGGDSGSLIFDDDRMGRALLFAGGDSGGANGMGLTYANPLDAVLAALKVELLHA